MIYKPSTHRQVVQNFCAKETDCAINQNAVTPDNILGNNAS
jgi:hypothetical protein